MYTEKAQKHSMSTFLFCKLKIFQTEICFVCCTLKLNISTPFANHVCTQGVVHRGFCALGELGHHVIWKGFYVKESLVKKSLKI